MSIEIIVAILQLLSSKGLREGVTALQGWLGKNDRDPTPEEIRALADVPEPREF